jgi:hypothetical protein
MKLDLDILDAIQISQFNLIHYKQQAHIMSLPEDLKNLEMLYYRV